MVDEPILSSKETQELEADIKAATDKLVSNTVQSQMDKIKADAKAEAEKEREKKEKQKKRSYKARIPKQIYRKPREAQS